MQQRTYDFLAKLKVPMLTFGGELMGEAVEMVIDDLNSHRFMSMRDIEASLADKFNCSPGVADRRMRYALDMAEYRSALDMAEYRSGGVNIELENLKSTYDIKVLSLKKFLYAAGRSLMTEVSVGNDRG
jgi:hypothetical protein